MKQIYFLLILIFSGLLSCKTDPKNAMPKKDLPPAKVPAVSADSMMNFVEKQLSFGVRYPGSEGHLKVRDWIVAKMKSYGAEVSIQEFKASFLGKKDVPSYNIIARINPKLSDRIALFAHYDSRLIAEKDKDVSKQGLPILGAVDGAGGVAGLIEIARQLKENPAGIGVDFVFFDAEDQGEEARLESWCLGSQHWSQNPDKDKEKPKFGILMDLVGAAGSVYGKEEISFKMAQLLQENVWQLARSMGKSDLFVNLPVGPITDDHYYVNLYSKIPTIDIIATKPTGQFGDYHHTHGDTIEALDKNILASVVQVVTAVVYKTSDGSFKY
jgi:Zn-dependent M28 family amino/carboxypeptidase